MYIAGIVASFVLGMWFSCEWVRVPGPRPSAVTATISKPANPDPAISAVAPAGPAKPGAERAYVLVASDPRAAMEEAVKLPDDIRLFTMQNLMAVWLRCDRLSAAEWMSERRGAREFEPLSAQVSDAFFPDDTEMSAMFSFDLSDAKLRDVRVNRLVAYWKSGAHLKFDNSPWEVDCPVSGSVKTEPSPASQPETAAANPATSPTEPQG